MGIHKTRNNGPLNPKVLLQRVGNLSRLQDDPLIVNLHKTIHQGSIFSRKIEIFRSNPHNLLFRNFTHGTSCPVHFFSLDRPGIQFIQNQVILPKVFRKGLSRSV